MGHSDNPMREESLSRLLSNVNIDVIVAKKQTVSSDWKRTDYVHSFNRMYYIIDGEGKIEVDGVAYEPKPRQLLVLPCLVRQSYETNKRHPYQKYWCHFTAKAGGRDLFEMIRFPICVDVPPQVPVEQWFRDLITYKSSSSPASILRVRAAMMYLISFFVEQGFGQIQIKSTSTYKMNDVLQFIEKHLAEHITVEQLAAIVHYHPNYFIRAFRSVFGYSPIQYINRLRLEKARQLLATEQSISEIAHSVGIDPHNFSTLFKRYTGFSPRNYRQMLRS